jgi:hypothetical protein
MFNYFIYIYIYIYAPVTHRYTYKIFRKTYQTEEL